MYDRDSNYYRTVNVQCGLLHLIQNLFISFIIIPRSEEPLVENICHHPAASVIRYYHCVQKDNIKLKGTDQYKHIS